MNDAVVAVVACALFAACNDAPSPGASEGASGSCTLAIEWGVGAGASFVPLQDGDPAPVTTDSGGGCFIDSSVRLTGSLPSEVTFDTTVTPAGYQPEEQIGRALELSAGGDGSLYASGLRVALDEVPPQDMPGWAVVMLVAHAGACTAWTAVDVQLTEGSR